MLTPEQRARQVKTYFQNQKVVQVAYLFGSAARGNMGMLSDVDVGVIMNVSSNDMYEARLRLMEGLAWIFGTSRVDVVILNTADPVLAHRVIFEGQPIFVRDETVRARFERKILNKYMDTTYLRQVQRASIKEQVGGGKYFG